MAEFKTIAPSDWPKRDRDAWSAAQTSGDIFDDGGKAANWRPATVANFEHDYGRWLGWLAGRGELDPHAAPGDRLSYERLCAYVADLRQDTAPVTVANYVRRLYTAMQLFEPDKDWSWLREVKAHLRRTEAPTKSKPEALTHPSQLYSVGLALMERAKADATSAPRKRAITFRDGLIIAMLAARAPRRQSLANMQLETNLCFAGDCYWLLFGVEETKNKRAAEHRLPPDLTPYISTYLDAHRPVLASGPRTPEPFDAVWLGELGQRLGQMAINRLVTKHTRHALGHPIPPHRFRDCLATAWAVDLPEHVRMSSAMLDHHDPSMTEQHYNQARRHQALRSLHTTIEAFRGTTAHSRGSP